MLYNLPQCFQLELAIAAQSDDLEWIRYTIQRCKTISLYSVKSSLQYLPDPVYIAAQSIDDSIMSELLGFYGVSTINHIDTSSGNAPLHIASILGNDLVVKVLLSYRADPLILNKEGNSALELAKLNRHCEVTQVLKSVKKKDSINSLKVASYVLFKFFHVLLKLSILLIKLPFEILSFFSKGLSLIYRALKYCFTFSSNSSSFYSRQEPCYRASVNVIKPERPLFLTARIRGISPQSSIFRRQAVY